MKKCDCYKTIEKIRYSILGIPHFTEVGICNGTKEREECSCGGDRTKCNFYPDVREEVNKELKKNMSNGDKIRSMSDKELAEFLMSKWYVDDVCKKCECHDNYDKCGDMKFCTNEILKYLKRTAD